MVIDTSALAAIVFNEAEAEALAQAIETDSLRLLSAGNYLEASVVVEARYGEAGAAALDELIRAAQVDVVPVTPEQARLGRQAFRKFGKGRHPAGLNFGDCFAYALAQLSGESLLFKGNDFSRTDIGAVSWQR